MIDFVAALPPAIQGLLLFLVWAYGLYHFLPSKNETVQYFALVWPIGFVGWVYALS